MEIINNVARSGYLPLTSHVEVATLRGGSLSVVAMVAEKVASASMTMELDKVNDAGDNSSNVSLHCVLLMLQTTLYYYVH